MYTGNERNSTAWSSRSRWVLESKSFMFALKTPDRPLSHWDWVSVYQTVLSTAWKSFSLLNWSHRWLKKTTVHIEGFCVCGCVRVCVCIILINCSGRTVSSLLNTSSMSVRWRPLASLNIWTFLDGFPKICAKFRSGQSRCRLTSVWAGEPDDLQSCRTKCEKKNKRS